MRRASVLAVLACAGCLSTSINSQQSPAADFSRLSTWSWYELPASARPQGITMGEDTMQRIRALVEAELGAKGYPRATTGAPDFLVSTVAVIGRSLDATTGSSTLGYGWGHSYMVGGGQEMSFDEGTLLIDALDGRTRELLWRGSATGAIDPDRPADQREARAREVVHDIMARFPAKAAAEAPKK
jgi:hypothetical protein